MERGPADDDRRETQTEKLDRNWDELLQEFRVTQTGVQILAGFLLTLPFQQRFASVTDSQRTVYLVSLAAAVIATVLFVAPVSAHRLLFRQHAKGVLVEFGSRCAQAGMAFLAVSLSAATFLIVDVVLGRSPAVIATAAAALLFAVMWVVVPLSLRRAGGADGPSSSGTIP